MHKIASKLVKTIEKFNRVGVIHNDLKADNIMIDVKKRIFRKNTYSIKVIDFGYCKFKGESPYPTLEKEKMLNYYVHLDIALAEGGACSEETDFYSLGRLLEHVYEYHKEYKCMRYM